MIEIIQNVGIRLKFSYIHVPGFADVGSVQHEHDYVPQTLKRFLILPSPQVLRVVCGHHTWVLRPLFWVTEWDWVRFSAMSCKIRYRLPSFQVVVFLILGPRTIRKMLRQWNHRLGIPLKTEGNLCFSYECQIPTKNTGPGRICCLLSLITGFTARLPGTGDCRCSHGCWDVLGMDAAWFREGPQMSRNCPQCHGASYAEKVLFL